MTRAPRSFAGLLLRWFARNGRAHLPWRTNRDPYRIIVSETMLAQTQVERVVPSFAAFVARWPSFTALASASQADIVRAWQGLGYNSRAVRLHQLAKAVVSKHGGVLPREEPALRSLPGVGAYTARALRAFAFNADALAADTNVRRIVHRTQYGVEWPPRARALELDAVGAALLPRGNGYAFNSALMDLGAMLCTARAPKCLLCPIRTACAAAPVDAVALAALAKRYAPRRGPQQRLRFEATTRYVRGRVIERLRALPDSRGISLLDLHADLASLLEHHDAAAVAAAVQCLQADGILEVSESGIRLAN